MPEMSRLPHLARPVEGRVIGDDGDYILWLIDGLFGNLIRAAIVLESASVVDFFA
jgi:hypothetical protein